MRPKCDILTTFNTKIQGKYIMTPPLNHRELINDQIRWMNFTAYFKKAVQYSKDRNDNTAKMLKRANVAMEELMNGLSDDRQKLAQLLHTMLEHEPVTIVKTRKKRAKEQTVEPNVDESGTLTLEKE